MRRNIITLATSLVLCGCVQSQVGSDPLVGYTETGVPIRQHTSAFFALSPFPKEIADQLDNYSDCLSDAFVKAANANNADRTGLRGNWLASCAETRRKAVAEADQMLRNGGWTDANQRKATLNRTFDERDAEARASAQEFMPAAGS